MATIKMFKPDGRTIEINDKDDAVKVMIKDGWRLKESDVQDTPPKRSPRRRKAEANGDEQS